MLADDERHQLQPNEAGYIHFSAGIRSKTRKRLKERFFYRTKQDKSTDFRGSPLFQATYNRRKKNKKKQNKHNNNNKTKTNKQTQKKPQTINSTYLVSVGCGRLVEGKGHETDCRDKEKGVT